jgi:hypothetical protein
MRSSPRFRTNHSNCNRSNPARLRGPSPTSHTISVASPVHPSSAGFPLLRRIVYAGTRCEEGEEEEIAVRAQVVVSRRLEAFTALAPILLLLSTSLSPFPCTLHFQARRLACSGWTDGDILTVYTSCLGLSTRLRCRGVLGHVALPLRVPGCASLLHSRIREVVSLRPFFHHRGRASLAGVVFVSAQRIHREDAKAARVSPHTF